jgi:hypothetical protein
MRDLRVKAILQKQRSDGTWYDCVATAWKTGYATELQIEKYWSANCMSGYYRTRGCTQLKFNNEWKPANEGCINTARHELRP